MLVRGMLTWLLDPNFLCGTCSVTWPFLHNVYCALRYIMDDVMRLGGHYDDDKDDHVTFEEYRRAVFGEDIEGELSTQETWPACDCFQHDNLSLSTDENAIYDKRYKHTFKDMIRRKKKVFTAADLNGDKKLTKDELADFLHPGECFV